MIGFGTQRSQRRPLYSLTGSKLCYVVNGADGDYFYDEAGRKLAKVTKWKKMLRDMEACSSLSGTVWIESKEEA